MNNTRHSIVDISVTRSNISGSRSSKWFIASLLVIIVLFTLLSVTILSCAAQLLKTGVLSNQQRLRQMNEINETSEDKTNPKSNSAFDIIEDMVKEKYVGHWTTSLADNGDLNTKNSNQSRVEVEFKLIEGRPAQNEQKAFIIKLKCFKGKYIDTWQSFESIIYSHDLNIANNIQSSLMLEGNYTSKEATGRLFKQKSKHKDCFSMISMTLTKDSNGLIDLSHMSIEYNSSCSSNLHLSLIQNIGKHSNNLREKISFYTFIASTTATISMIINFYLIKMLTQAESNIKAISIVFISINAIWNLYCFVINFSFAIKFNEHFFQFVIPSILFLCLFLLVDIQLLYYYFIIRRKTLSDRDVKKRIIGFGILVTLGLVAAFYFLDDFYFEKTGIMCLFILLLIPQIIHNTLWNNNTALPIAYITLVTVTRISIPLYFRGYHNNCFSIEPDNVLIAKCLIIELFLLMFLGSQSLFGARWFLPQCLRKNMMEEIYFYSQKDAMDLFPNYLDEDCVICLNKLFYKAIPLPDLKEDNIVEDQSVNGDVTIPSSYSNIKSGNEIFTALDSGQNQTGLDSSSFTSSSRLSLEIISSVVLSSLLDFHEWKFKKTKNYLPYMITQCHHLFHSQCLELWLRQVKKCPSCRKEITIIPI